MPGPGVTAGPYTHRDSTADVTPTFSSAQQRKAALSLQGSPAYGSRIDEFQLAAQRQAVNGNGVNTVTIPETSQEVGAYSERQSSHGAASTSGGAGTVSALASEAAYVLASSATILFNKHCLSSFHFPAPNTLLLYQFVFAVGLLKFLDILGFIHLSPVRQDTVRLWLPVNLIFVAMNSTGMLALKDIGAGMFTVLKNLSNLMTIAGDYIFFGHVYSWQVWCCLGLMILSALMGGWSDLTFTLSGYAWQLVNCLFTAAYSLYLSGVIRRVSQQQHDKQQLSELSMVYYNNLLSVPPLAMLSLVSGELWKLRGYQGIWNLEFQIVAFLGGLMGFAVSFASIWCMSRTSATIYSLTGSMNKVVVAVAGMWWFSEPTNAVNMVSIIIGLVAGFLFIFAKTGSTNARHSAAQVAVPKHVVAQDEEAAVPLRPSLSGSIQQTGGPLGGATFSNGGMQPAGSTQLAPAHSGRLGIGQTPRAAAQGPKGL